MGCVSSRDNDYVTASTSSNGYNDHQKQAIVLGTNDNRQKSKKKMFSKSSSCLSDEKNGSLRKGDNRNQTDDVSFLSISEQLDSSENFQTPKKRAKFRKKKLEDDVAKIKKRTKKTKNGCLFKQRSSSGDNATENGDVEKEGNSKNTKRKRQQSNNKLRANNMTTTNAQRGNISQDDKVGSKLAYANGDPTASPTINNNNSVGNNKNNQLNENGNGSLIPKNNHVHYDIDDVQSTNLTGSNSSSGGSSTTSSVPAEVLLKNFQDRLSTTQSKK